MQQFKNIGQSARWIFITIAILITGLFAFDFDQLYTQYQSDKKKLEGIVLLEKSAKLNLVLGQYRGSCVSFIAGAEQFAAPCMAFAEDIQDSLVVISEESIDKSIAWRYKKLSEQWRNLHENLQKFSANNFFTQATRLTDANIEIMMAEYLHAQLAVAANAKEFQFSRMLSDIVPNLQNSIGMLRGYGSGIISRGVIEEDDVRTLIKYQTFTEAVLNNLEQVYNNVATEPNVSDLLRVSYQNAVENISYFIRVNVEVLSKQIKPSQEGVGEYFLAGTRPIDSLAEVSNLIAIDLQKSISTNIQTTMSKMLLTFAVYVAIMLGLFFLYSRLRLSLDKISVSERFYREVSHSKSAFLANMSHELRTPLNGIYGVLQIIDSENNQPKHIKKLLKIALESSDMLAGLIGNVLDMEKIESREIHLEKEPFSLVLLVETYLPSFESLAKKNNVGFHVHIDESCHLYWKGDKLRIMQILNNVVGNAIKFSAGKTVQLEASSKTNILQFTVKDTGCGMDKNTLDNIFERFHKGRDNAAKGIESNGLGMAITKDLVDLMEGKISVTSEVGKGSEFVIELPLEAMEEPLKPEQAILKAIEELTEDDLKDVQDWRDSHVLLVDDAMTNLYVLEAMLSTMVKKVSIASSGDEALEVVYQDKVDILISDISMPGMNGMELLVKVRDFQPFIPAIALSGNVLLEDLKKYRQAGFDDVLTKPVQKQRLQACMEKVFILKQSEQNGVIPASDDHTLH